MEGSSGTTELPTSTIDGLTTLPAGMVNTGNMTDMTTTMLTTLPPAGAETTVVPATTAGVTQQIVTTAPMGAIDAQSTLTPITSAGTVVQNATQSANSLTAATSGESVQSTPAAGAETVAGSPNTITLMVNADNQTIPTTTTMAIVDGNQAPQTPSTIAAGDTGTSTNVPNAGLQASTDASVTMAAATDAGMMGSMSTDVQTPSAVAMNTEIPTTTNMLSPAMIVAGASTDALMSASTVVMRPANTSAPSATLSTVTMNSLNTVVPAIMNSANVTIPSPVTETTMVNGGISQSSTATSADTAAGNTPGTAAANDLAMTTTITDIDGAVNSATTVASSVPGANLAENNFTIANSTTSPVDSQMTASLIDENTISMNRKKKDLADIIDSNTVKDELADGSPKLRKREARSPRGYFSSYPGQVQLTNIFFKLLLVSTVMTCTK